MLFHQNIEHFMGFYYSYHMVLPDHVPFVNVLVLMITQTDL